MKIRRRRTHQHAYTDTRAAATDVDPHAVRAGQTLRRRALLDAESLRQVADYLRSPRLSTVPVDTGARK